jgi:hypothetical protein
MDGGVKAHEGRGARFQIALRLPKNEMGRFKLWNSSLQNVHLVYVWKKRKGD